MKGHREMTILIVEDDDGHAELIQSGLCAAGICNPIIRFSNGLEAWEYLNQDAQKADHQRCTLLLLDINMPIMDGVELLAKIKSDSELADTPVVMLTTTDEPREVEECYRLGCNFYVTKPVDFQAFAETLQRLGLFLQVVRV